MPSKKATVSVRLDAASARRVQRAAQIRNQSRGGFLEQAGNELAQRVLIDWAVAQQRTESRTFSELAEETGIAIEDLMAAVSREDRELALDAFLASCRTIASSDDNPEFLRLAEEAVAAVRNRALPA